MESRRTPWKIGKIVMIVAVEYLFFALLSVIVLRFFSPSPAQVASAGTILIGAVSLVNLMIASRMARETIPHGAAYHLKLLREEFLYLRWYFDEVLETMSSGILVLDRVLNVRSMNHAERDILSLKEKEELIGKPFRHHPLSQEQYEGEIYGHKGRPLLDILEVCARDGESLLLEDIRFNQGNGNEPKPLNILIYPWKNRDDETERLVLRMDDKSLPLEARGQLDLEKLLSGGPITDERLPLGGDSIGPSLATDFEMVKDHLEGLLASAGSLHSILDSGADGPQAELLLFEVQVQKIIGMIRQMQRNLDKGTP